MRSAHQSPETSTRFIGWCPVCQRDIKIRSGLLVHHGYERPGVGYIIGDCPGVGHKPYETGTDACDFYLRVYVIPNVRQTENTLTILTRPEGPPYLTFEHYDIATRRVIRNQRTKEPETINLTREQADDLAAQLPSWDKQRYSWEHRLRLAIANTESRLKHWSEEQDRMNRLVADWRLQPLRTVEQEIQRQEQTRSEREAARADARNTKIAAELAKIQKRIDSAVKNKNAAVLADIFRSDKLRAVSGYRLYSDEALSMLDRDDVWRAFGLLTQDGYLPGDDARDLLDEMTWGRRVPTDRPGVRYDYAPLPWPAALGGGTAKTRGL